MKRILLDHCVPKPLRRLLAHCGVRTCFECGWSMLRNSELLSEAEAAGFHVFVTADKNLRYQPRLSTRSIAIIELPTNWLSALPSLAMVLQTAIDTATQGSYVTLTLP